MCTYLTLLTLLVPLSALAFPTLSPSGIACSLFPSRCSNSTTINVYADMAGRIKPAPPLINTGLTPETASGDVLNSTRCYCASPNWRNDHTYGFYLLFTYYNYHHDATYNFDITCKSAEYDVVQRGNDKRIQPECLYKRQTSRWCQGTDSRGEIGGTFCYEMSEGAYADKYHFNEQTRGLPIGAAFRENEKNVLQICGGFCHDRVGGLDMLDGEALTAVINDSKGVGPSAWSAILSFGDTDDMCETCK